MQKKDSSTKVLEWPEETSLIVDELTKKIKSILLDKNNQVQRKEFKSFVNFLCSLRREKVSATEALQFFVSFLLTQPVVDILFRDNPNKHKHPVYLACATLANSLNLKLR